MPSYLVAYGMGGCWSGYPEAKIIDALDDDKAEEEAFSVAFDYAEEVSPRRRGYSYDFEIIESVVEKCLLYTRLKDNAKRLLAANI